jgi:DNA-binding response OmpR family regulator
MNRDKIIWILEDEEVCQFVYKQALEHKFSLEFFTSYSELCSRISGQEVPDLLIIDLLVDDGCFLDHKNQFIDAHKFSEVPFLVISSSDDLDIMTYLDNLGAKDYLVKPFNKNQLMLKVAKYIYKNEDFLSLDINSDDFTNKERKILSLFQQNGLGNPLSRRILDQKIWPNTSVTAKTLDVHIHNLRKKIKPEGFNIIAAGDGEWTLEKRN